MDRGITREQLERVARIYHHNQDASQALGIATRSFARRCRQHGIETPYVRKQRRRSAAGGTQGRPR